MAMEGQSDKTALLFNGIRRLITTISDRRYWYHLNSCSSLWIPACFDIERDDGRLLHEVDVVQGAEGTLNL